MPRTNIPSYRLHKPSEQAIVSLCGKIFYLGKYKTKSSREKYTELIVEYTANNRKLAPIRSRSQVLIEKLVFDYLVYAEKYYPGSNNNPSKAFGLCKHALERVVTLYHLN